jgi:hypothetical protein
MLQVNQLIGFGVLQAVGGGFADITVVGSAENQNTAGGTITLTLPSMNAGDLVLVFEGEAGTAGPRGMSTSGYTNAMTAQDQSTVSLGAYWKIMGGTPDATAVVNAGANTVGHAATCIVLRGVDQTTPIDATTTTATGTTDSPNCPSITTVTNKAFVCIAAAKDVTDTTITYPGSGFTQGQQDINSNTTTDVTVASAGATAVTTPAGAVDPLGFSGWTSGANWIAATFAIRPAAL